MQEPQHTKKHRKWRWQAVILFLGLFFGLWFLLSRFMKAAEALMIVLFGIPLLWAASSALNDFLEKAEKKERQRHSGRRSLAGANASQLRPREDPKLEELDRLRKQLRNRKLLFLLLYVLFLVCLWVALYSLLPLGAAYILSLFSPALLLKPALSLRRRMIQAPGEAYRSLYKRAFVERALGSQFTALRYSPGWALSEPFYSAIQSLFAWNNVHIHSEDCMTARYGDIAFEQAEIRVTGGAEGGNALLFQGRWMSFAFNKQFHSNCFIVQRGSPVALRMEKTESNHTPYQAVFMESEDFNERFLVGAPNPHEAFYLLTPQMMERLLHLSSAIEGRLMFFFMDNRLYVAVRSDTNAYEPPKSVMRSLNMYEEIGRTQEEIDLITQLVDALHCNNDLFLTTE